MAITPLQVAFVQCALLYVIVQMLPFPPQPNTEVKYRICTESEAKCWQRGQLSSIAGDCYEPLTTSLCKESHWFILNRNHDHLQGCCAPKPCSDGLFPLEDTCVAEAEVRNQKCSGGAVFFNAAGQLQCGEIPLGAHGLHAFVTCMPSVFPPVFPPILPPRPVALIPGNIACPLDNNEKCIRQVITDSSIKINILDISES